MANELFQLVEKIARAKMILEDARMQHKSSCTLQNDPETLAPCNCGASEINAVINKAIEELSLDN